MPWYRERTGVGVVAFGLHLTPYRDTWDFEGEPSAWRPVRARWLVLYLFWWRYEMEFVLDVTNWRDAL